MPVQPVVVQAQVEKVVAQAQVVAPAGEHQALVSLHQTNLGEGLLKVGSHWGRYIFLIGIVGVQQACDCQEEIIAMGIKICKIS